MRRPPLPSPASLVPAAITFVTLIGVLALGMWLGARPELLPGPVQDVVVDEDRVALAETLDTVEDRYYRKVGRGELVDHAAAGVVEKLDDRFSQYLDAKSYHAYRNQIDGALEGVGMTVSGHPRGIRVRSVIKGAPAERAGIRKGTVILSANGHPLKGLALDAATRRILGPRGTAVRLVWLNDGKKFDKRVVRDRIEVPPVESALRGKGDRKVAWIRLDTFSGGAHGFLRQAVDDALEDRAKGIVLDLRGNGGGLLKEAVLVSSIFIPDGTIVKTASRADGSKTYSATGGAITGRLPLVVLVDRDTASASEIVAGALQDRDRATVVGTRTFGKGVFQELFELENGGALDITVGQYFTPKGRNLGGEGTKPGDGITPDVESADDPKTSRDEALDRALGLVRRR